MMYLTKQHAWHLRWGSKEQVKDLFDAVHRSILSAFGVPLRDRYQVYQEDSESNFIVQDTGLGIERTKKAMVISITSRPRKEGQKTVSVDKALPGSEAKLRY